VGWCAGKDAAGKYGRDETATRQTGGCTGPGRRESKREREDSKDGRVGRDSDGEMVRFLYTTLQSGAAPKRARLA